MKIRTKDSSNKYTIEFSTNFYETDISTLQMLTDKLLINYYFHMLLLQVKMCKLFRSG